MRRGGAPYGAVARLTSLPGEGCAVATPQDQSTDHRSAYGTLYLDANLERYGFTLAPAPGRPREERWLVHESCGMIVCFPTALPASGIWSLAARHLRYECE